MASEGSGLSLCPKNQLETPYVVSYNGLRKTLSLVVCAGRAWAVFL